MKHLLSRFIPQTIKNIYHLAQAVFACIFFCFPARHLFVIGVTGTDGKTTTTQFIARILEQSGKKIALASTINFQIGERCWTNTTKHTTLDAWRLQKFLAKAKKEGCTHVVIETASHALDQYRVWGIPYAIAVLTNVTREHLDYHKTMEVYRATKRRLFLLAKQAVVNDDMQEPEFFALPGKRTIFYSTKNEQAEVYAEHIELDFQGTEFIVDGTRFCLHVPGLFNIENALAALGVARLMGIDFSLAAKALEAVRSVAGRMELIPNYKGADILIDYAVTPNAFEKLYASILPLKIPGSKIIHVFGACGDRDRGKRPLLGEIASSYADVVIVTNEDPYYEDPERIIDEIERGVIKKKSKQFFRIFDRRQAIRKALTLMEIGDIVLITGKGAEETMALRGERLLWNDKKVIEEELKKMTIGS